MGAGCRLACGSRSQAQLSAIVLLEELSIDTCSVVGARMVAGARQSQECVCVVLVASCEHLCKGRVAKCIHSSED